MFSDVGGFGSRHLLAQGTSDTGVNPFDGSISVTTYHAAGHSQPTDATERLNSCAGDDNESVPQVANQED